MRVRRLDGGDRDRCVQLAVLAGWGAEPRKWDLLLTLGPAFAIDGDDGALAAMVALPELEGASFVAMMAVDPGRRRQGLGRRLLEHAMAQVAPPLMLYASELGRPLYERLGFEQVDSVHRLAGQPRATEAHSDVALATASDHARILEADAHAFGLGRARLLERLVADADRVVVEPGGGFAIRWSTGGIGVVGPVVARDQPTAISLVDGALVGCLGRVRVGVTPVAPGLVAHLRALGLDEVGPAPLMTWPRSFLPGDRGRYHAIALPAFG